MYNIRPLWERYLTVGMEREGKGTRNPPPIAHPSKEQQKASISHQIFMDKSTRDWAPFEGLPGYSGCCTVHYSWPLPGRLQPLNSEYYRQNRRSLLLSIKEETVSSHCEHQLNTMFFWKEATSIMLLSRRQHNLFLLWDVCFIKNSFLRGLRRLTYQT